MEDYVFKQLTTGIYRPKHKIGLFLCGTSGSGKTSSRTVFMKDAGLKTSYVYINVDNIRESVSFDEAIVLVKKILERVIESGYSFLWDATCRNKSTILKILELANSKGYSTRMGILYASMPTVLNRIKNRTHQPLEEKVAIEIYRHVKRNIETYMKTEYLDEIYLYNNEEKLKLIFSKKGDEIECVSPTSKFYFNIKPYCK